MTESSIDLRFPDLAGIVGRWYSKTQAALDGMPPHVTLLYPWVPTPSEAAIERVDEVVRTYSPFSVVFAECGRFDGVALYLRPDSNGVIESIMADPWKAFAETPPYGGAHGVSAEPIPHLTVTKGPDEHLDEVAGVLGPKIASSPVRCLVTEVVVSEEGIGPHGRWGVSAVLHL